jgi:hypothetical protein
MNTTSKIADRVPERKTSNKDRTMVMTKIFVFILSTCSIFFENKSAINKDIVKTEYSPNSSKC